MLFWEGTLSAVPRNLRKSGESQMVELVFPL